MPKRRNYSFESFLQQISVPVALFLLVLVFGSLGYYTLWQPENGTWLDAIYMTFITVTTVGYNEIHPLNSAGRILTIFVSITGIASLFYLFTAVMEFLVTRRLSDPFGRRRMQKKIEQLKDHTILVGYGKIGQHIAEELTLEHSPFVVIDSDSSAEQLCLDEGYLVVRGDAEEDDVLEQAGVKRAKALISAIGNDAMNAFVVMSARAINSDLFIVAKADEDSAMRKLMKAGANSTINPYATAGQRLVNMVIRPATLDFLTNALQSTEVNLSIQDVLIPKNSSLVHKSLGALALRNLTGVTVVAVIRGSSSFPNPAADFVLAEHDHLMVLGDATQQEKLTYLLADSLTDTTLG